MFDQLSELVKQFGNDAVVNNPAVPNEQNDAVMNEAGSSILSGLKDMVANGNVNDLSGLLSGNSAINANNPVVKQDTVAKPAVEKPVSPVAVTPAPEFVLLAEPNPATSFTIISYTLPKRMQVTLSVLDNNGKEVLKLADAFQSTGKQLIRFNTSTLAAGNYQIKISGEKIEKTIQVVVKK